MNEIDKYLNNVKPEYKIELERVRKIIKELVPDAQEVINYGMPTIQFKGKNVIHFAAFKSHMSIFPTAEPIAELQEQLKNFKVSKGTIQFTLDKTLPEKLVRDLVLASLENVKARLVKK